MICLENKMGSDDVFKKRGMVSRKKPYRTIKQTFLIVCEGECTEPNYFKSFKISSANIKIIGTGYNTLSLVEKTIELMDKEEYDQVWSVFDRDSFTAQNFNAAFELANKNKIKVAYSNEAFELWYLLHFHYYNSGISRKTYKEKLTKLLKHKYEKNSKIIYDEVFDKQNNAIRNAKKLLNNYDGKLYPEKANPSTTVHILVEELNKFL